jgi:DNA-binding transcriptional MerR regulator
MNETVHIGEAARRLGVSPKHLHALEGVGHILPERRDFNGRIYNTEFDIAVLRSMDIGSRPREVRRPLEGGHAKVGHRSPEKEQLVREERAVSKKTPKYRGRGRWSPNAWMCRN